MSIFSNMQTGIDMWKNLLSGKTLQGTAPVHSGSWFGGLPDIGATEVLAKERGIPMDPATGGSQNFGEYVQPNAPQTGSNRNYTTGTYNPSNSGGTSSGNTSTGGNNGGGGGDSGGGGPSMMDIINEAFNQEQGYLNTLETTSKQNAEGAYKQADIEKQAALEDVQGQREIRNEELGNRETETRLDARQGMIRIKQMLNDLSNRNAAYLASRGGAGFGSSLGQALGEKMGRYSAQQVGGLETEKIKSLNAIKTEIGKVGQFFDNQVAQLGVAYRKMKENIRQELSSKLAQIQGMKAESAKAKAAATMQAWQGYVNSRSQLNIQAANFSQNLMQWALEKGKSLEQAQKYAMANTPTLNPSAFGIMPPNMGMNTSSQSPFSQGTYIRGKQPQDELAKLGILPSTVS